MVQLFNDLMGVKDRGTTRKAKGIILSLLLTTCAAFTACTDETLTTTTDDCVPLGLAIDVLQNDSRAIVEGTSLPHQSKIGLAVQTYKGADYENKGYNNVLYTVSGGTCSTDEDVLLSATEAKVYAYYPYNEEVTDITAIPVEVNADVTAQDDYMYATYNSGVVSMIAPNVSLTMNHILSGIRVGIKQTSGTYAPVVNGISVKSDGMCHAALMNARDGSLHTFTGQGEEFSVMGDRTLTTEYQYYDTFYFLPTGEEATLRFIMTVEGQDYLVITPKTLLAQGSVYTYTFVFDNQNFFKESSEETE